MVACFGGWDAASVIDPKDPKKAPVDVIAGSTGESGGNIPYRTLDLKGYPAYAGLEDQVEAFFRDYHDKTVVLRGIDVGSLAHAACRVRILTGTDDATRPDWVAVTASEIGYDRPLPYVDLGGNGYMGNLGRLVGRFGVDSQISALVDPHTYEEYVPTNGPLYVPDSADEDAIANYVLGRAQEQLGTRAKLGYNNDRVQDFLESYARASSLGPHLTQLPDAGVFTELYNQVEMVPQLLAGDPLCQTIFLDSRLPWDTHFDNDALQVFCYQEGFRAINQLLAGLQAEGLLDETLVVVMSEMGRTPMTNNVAGKDHWPTTSALLIGGGLQGDRVVGETSPIMNALKIDFESGLADDKKGRYMMAPDFIATLMNYVGVDHREWLPEGDVIDAVANG